MARNNRKGAQDLLNEANLVFATKGTFEDAFPGIATIRIEYEETGQGVRRFGTGGHEGAGKGILTDKKRIGQYLRCSNPLCYGGGYDIVSVVRDMVSKNEEEREGSGCCQGNEGSPKGQRIYRTCMNYFKYRITITYSE